jgi:DNA-binding response OmpR family regulator
MARILVVDDQENQESALAAGLRSQGFDVIVAGTVAGAHDALAGGRVEVALIHLMIPGLNGLELAREIRAADPGVRVVLSSAYHLSARQVERADCGAVGFVPKPYRIAELVSFLGAKAKPHAAPPC